MGVPMTIKSIAMCFNAFLLKKFLGSFVRLKNSKLPEGLTYEKPYAMAADQYIKIVQ
jgi:hypothetical protein